FEKRADGCHREISGGLQARDARITIVTTQPSGFCELEEGPFGVSFKSAGGGEPGMMARDCRIGAAPSFEPADRLVDPRLRQMRLPNPEAPHVEIGIAGAETDGLLMEGDCLPRRAGEQLAPPYMGVRVHQIAIERERGFVFGNRFVEAVLRTEHMS